MKLGLVMAFSLTASGLAYSAEQQAPAAPAADTSAPAQAAAAPEGTAAPEGAAANEAVCTSGKDTRRVKLDVSTDKCLVIYLKETEKPGTAGDTLYTFNHEMDKCKQKYSEFVEKLRGMQWTCS